MSQAQDPTPDPELLARIAAYPDWRHRIEVAPGVFTAGKNCAGKLRLMGLPERLDGLRVLDVGASDGFFAFECERRGAAEVVALDVRTAGPSKLGTGFELAKAALGSKVRFVEGSLYDTDLGTFDLVLCLNVLYHVPEPFFAVRRLWEYAKPRGRVIVCTMAMDDGMQLPDGSTAPLAEVAPALKDAPIMQFLPGVAGWEGQDSAFWQMSTSALVAMMRRAGFVVDGVKLAGAHRVYLNGHAVPEGEPTSG